MRCYLVLTLLTRIEVNNYNGSYAMLFSSHSVNTHRSYLFNIF